MYPREHGFVAAFCEAFNSQICNLGRNSLFKLFKKYLKPFGGLVIAAILFTFLQVVAELQLPDIMARIVDTGIYNKDLNYVIVRSRDAGLGDRFGSMRGHRGALRGAGSHGVRP